jgi:subtilisin-like proprotein convertase family protein
LAAAYSTATAQVTFTNSNSLVIFNIGPASQYPSTITVSGYTGTITDVTVSLTGFHHTFVSDLGVVFSGPANQGMLLFDGGPDGGTGPAGDGSPINLVFSAAGSSTIPAGGTNLVSGTYLPGLNDFGDILDPPAPNSPYAMDFSSLIGQSPNGTYNLFIEDFVTFNNGGVGSWSITLSGISPIPEPTSLTLLGVSVIGGLLCRRRRAVKSSTVG